MKCIEISYVVTRLFQSWLHFYKVVQRRVYDAMKFLAIT